MTHLQTPSTAKGQRCLFCGQTFPLYPPVIGGCPHCQTESFKAPLEVMYDYPEDIRDLLQSPLPGLTRYAPLLPPLVESLSMGEGGTALIPISRGKKDGGREIYVKDEGRNPTMSHKDRLNLVVSSTASILEAPGIVAASSGNHGASAAAYAARAGLPAVILTTPRPPAIASFMQAFHQLVVAVPDAETRWELMDRVIEEFGYHPASNQTTPPTNHPFGSEGYKTIAYELYLQLDGRAPEAVFVPVGYAELFFGIYKGFKELLRYQIIDTMPRMIACEPEAGAPLKKALELDQPVATVDTGDTGAYSIAVPVSSYRGFIAASDSGGASLAVSDEAVVAAQYELGKNGIWPEMSGAISVAALDFADELELGSGPIICVNTSNGFKDMGVGRNLIPEIDGSWQALLELMRDSELNKRNGG